MQINKKVENKQGNINFVAKSNIARRGYDIIRSEFFVETIVPLNSRSKKTKIKTISFNKFEYYYNFLEGDIYTNACYYGYEFTEEEIEQFSISVDRVNFQSLIDYTIDDSSIDFSKDEIEAYKEREEVKEVLVDWLDKINSCNQYSSFINLVREFKKTSTFKIFGNYSEMLDFFLFNRIFHDKESAFEIALKIALGRSDYKLVRNLCSIYGSQCVLEYGEILSSKKTFHTLAWKKNVIFYKLCENEIQYESKSYFDKRTHFYVYETIGMFSEGEIPVSFKRYFKSIRELVYFLNYNLKNCNLSDVMISDYDFSNCIIDKTTVLPIGSQGKIICRLDKRYDKETELFIVQQNWFNQNGTLIKQNEHIFDYFFDFIYFIKNDLSSADLLYCDGIANLKCLDGIDTSNIFVRSDILEKIGAGYKYIDFELKTNSYENLVVNNEDETTRALVSRRDSDCFEEQGSSKIYYITDLHLLHRLQKYNCKNKGDVRYYLEEIVRDLFCEYCLSEGDILLIGGDTSSNFEIFKEFVFLLGGIFKRKKKRSDINIIFVLGNHELWDFSDKKLDETIAIYKNILEENGMFLLQDNIIFRNCWGEISIIDTDELQNISYDGIREELRFAKEIFFGGVGFFGCNNEFNANNGIYRGAISREQEILASRALEKSYEKICRCLSDRTVVVLTHMPPQNWCKDFQPQNGFVYVCGHTHRNYFSDDGVYRIYADNQVGYKGCRIGLKYFIVDAECDYFLDYNDGIYEIERSDYIKFYRGINTIMVFFRDVYRLFMLKKNGYYCFIHMSKTGNLSIMNGGAKKRLSNKDINYYYENMDKTIEYIKQPLDRYSAFQISISKEIKAIGGSGTIHGAIIDIDFFNHIYLNSIDLKMTPYWACDMNYKLVYPDLTLLLKDNCPELYAEYNMLLKSNSNRICLLKDENGFSCEGNGSNSGDLYLETDIYKSSRIIKKMQKLYSRVLTIWIEPSGIKLLDKDNVQS